jgi:hypothetical protein
MKRVSLLAALGLAGFALVPAAGAVAATARPAASGPAAYAGTMHRVTSVAASARGLAGLPTVKPARAAAAGRVIRFRSPGGSSPALRSARGQAVKVRASGLAVPASALSGHVRVLHRFNGLSNADTAAAFGTGVTPPDQGLCVGPVPPNPQGVKGTVVFEAVNMVLRISTPGGKPVETDPLSTVFQDPNAVGDPRCLYDPATKSYFFTEIGYPPSGPSQTGNNTTVDVTVLNAKGVRAYQFDTSSNQNCFGDQPKTGLDASALLVSTDQYCGPTESDYQGAIVLAISKAQLAALAGTVNVAQFGPVSLGGIPVTGLDPAIGAGYFVNSFPFDASGNNNAVSNSLGLWRITGDSAVTTGHGTVTLTGKLIRSEFYAFPMPAASTGDGSVSVDGITAEPFLNPDDSRLSGPVTVTRAHRGIQLWTALDSAVVVHGAPAAVDGAAWFELDAVRQRVDDQGYVAVGGANLLYPALQGPSAMVFTITSPHINPAAAFTVLGSGKVTVAAAGTGPHRSWSDVTFGSGRWGDYSFTAPDPGGKGIWMATEYIPPKASQLPKDNWGTSVFEISK